MVLSAIAVGAAFATPAAAQSSPVQEDSVELGGSTVTINTGGAGAIGVDDLPSDVAVSEISDGGGVPGPNPDGIAWSSATGLPDTVSFTLTPDSSYSAGDSVPFTVDGTSVSLDVVEGSSGGDYELPDTASVGPPHVTYDDYDSLIGQAQWAGQEIRVNSAALSDSDSVQIRERIDEDTTQLRTEVNADSGYVQFDTSDLESGNFYLYSPSASFGAASQSDGENADNTFGLTEMSLTGEFDEDSVTDEGPNSDTDFEFESNRGNYPVNVTADGDLSAEELGQIFEGSGPFTVVGHNEADDDDEITIKLEDVTGDNYAAEGGITDSDDYTLDFTDIDTGSYEFTFSGADSTAESTDTIEVTESNAEVSFTEGSQTIAAGDIASFNATLEDTSSTFVQIGGEDSNFVEVLYLEEDESDEPIQVDINTRLLGTDADLDAVYDTSNVDTILSANHGGIPGSAVEDNEGFNPYNTGSDTDINLYEDDGNKLGSFDEYVDSIGIADNAADQLSRPLQPTDYQISAASDLNVDDALFDADPGGEANNQLGSKTLQLQQPTIGDITIHTAPEETADDTTNVADLVDQATPTSEVAAGDRLIAQVEATGIFGSLVANVSGTEDASNFDRLTDDGMSTQVLHNLEDNDAEGVNFGITAQEDIGNQDALEVDLTATDQNTYVVLDQANDQFFVIVDTSSDDAFDNGDAPSSTTDFTASLEYDADEDDDRYEFADSSGHPGAFDATGSSQDNFPYLTQGEVLSSSSEFSVAPRSIEYDNVNANDTIELGNVEDSELSATTNVAPGSDAEIRVSSTDASSTFRQGNDLNITEDGSITTTFDLADQEVGDEFESNFRVSGSSVDTADGVVVESVDTGADDGEETNETDTDDGSMNETDDGMTDDGETNESTDDGSTDDGTPGFGAVVALVALIGAALLAVRRQN